MADMLDGQDRRYREPNMEPAATLEEVARELGVSIERVRQIEKRAMEKVRIGFRRFGIRCAQDGAADEPASRFRATVRRGGC